MYFLEFYPGNILYMFRIDKPFIFRSHFYCTCSLWYVLRIHVDSIVVAASPHECVIHTINCMYSKISSWRGIASLFETCRGCYQNKIQESASRWFYYTILPYRLRPILAILIREIYTYWKVPKPLYFSSPENGQDWPKHVGIGSDMEVFLRNALQFSLKYGMMYIWCLWIQNLFFSPRQSFACNPIPIQYK